jgi:hypothetical protein
MNCFTEDMMNAHLTSREEQILLVCPRTSLSSIGIDETLIGKVERESRIFPDVWEMAQLDIHQVLKVNGLDNLDHAVVILPPFKEAYKTVRDIVARKK